MRKEKMDLVEKFKDRKILVIGDALLDNYVYGVTERICREAPVPVFAVRSNHYECGGAANTAINVATLGAAAFFVTVLGKDQPARVLTDELKKHQVGITGIIQDRTRSTLVKKRIIAASNILLRIDEGENATISAACEQRLLNNITNLYHRADAVILSDYGYGTITDPVLQHLQQLRAQSPRPFIVDARNLARYQVLRPDFIKPNYEEAIHLLGLEKFTGAQRIKQVLSVSDRLLRAAGSACAAVTLDADGVVLLEQGKEPCHLPCTPQSNSKAIGAGDTFTAALALSCATGANRKMATEIAATAAAVVLMKEGTAGCCNYELQAHINATPKYITDLEALVAIVADLRTKGKKIVFTNGCFDIIHKGHITLLEQAKMAGDILIVGLNADNSIRKIKGAGRPVNRLDDRIRVLSGLSGVDYIVSFEETTSARLIRALRPDVFVKGGTYTEASIKEVPLVKKLGGRVLVLPKIEQSSTSGIINRLQAIAETRLSLHALP